MLFKELCCFGEDRYGCIFLLNNQCDQCVHSSPRFMEQQVYVFSLDARPWLSQDRLSAGSLDPTVPIPVTCAKTTALPMQSTCNISLCELDKHGEDVKHCSARGKLACQVMRTLELCRPHWSCVFSPRKHRNATWLSITWLSCNKNTG